MVSLFSTNDAPTFTIIGLDTSVLSGYYSAQVQARTLSSLPTAAQSSASRGPAVVTPWDNQGAEKTLVRRFNELRDQDDFIRLDSAAVLEAGANKDEKALFALYEGLSDLQALAQYAADEATPDALLARIHNQFQNGLAQVQDYISDVELDKLVLLFGEKANRVETGVSLGKDPREQVFQTVHVGDKTAPLVGVQGDEVFTINITAGSNSDDVIVDLSEIEGDVTITSLNSLINSKIAEFTTVDSNGENVSKYSTRFSVEEVAEERYALKVKLASLEELTFSAAVTEPALYVTGTHLDDGLDAVETGTLTKLGGLTGSNATQDFKQDIAGLTGEISEVPTNDDEDVVTDVPVGTTSAVATAVDSQGSVYVVGQSIGSFDREINTAEISDVFLTKYDASGNVVWNRLLGAADQAEAYAVAVDNDDNVLIAGHVNSEIEDADLYTGQDSFVAKYDGLGTELWVQQLDSVASDQAASLAVDSNGDVIVVGQTSGIISSSLTSAGGKDAYALRLSGSDGSVLASSQFGAANDDIARATALASDGHVLVASEEDGRAVLRKLDAADLSSTLWSVDLGDLNGGRISGLAVEGGNVYLAGVTGNSSLSGGGSVVNAASGGDDGFVTRISDNGGSGAADWTHFLGSNDTDSIEAIIAQGGNVYVAGRTTGSLPGETLIGSSNGYAAKINGTTGSTDWIQQFGGVQGQNGSTGIAFSQNGSSILTTLGLPVGTVNYDQERTIVDQTTARAGDHFYISIDDRAPIKVTIREDDTYESLAARIDRLSLTKMEASKVFSAEGPTLKIEAKNGGEIRILAGDGGEDALAKLGLEPAKILPTEVLFKLDSESEGTDPDDLGGVFGLRLETNWGTRSKKEAEYVANQLDFALSTIQRAFRSLTFDPLKAQLLQQSRLQSGTISSYQASQLANYQSGLNNLLIGSGGVLV
ncbi:MAG: hypothetical protein CMF31_01920 [Kordiimonas sp.]|nr:hypothetical protein [Kordiimonas sp.]